MKTIIFKPIHHINSDELDFSLREQVLQPFDEDEEYREIYESKLNYLNSPIKIETLRGFLDDLEERGANFVAIDYHTDHIEYELDGMFITEATQDEIDYHEKKDKEFELKYAKEQLANVEKTADNFRKAIFRLSGE